MDKIAIEVARESFSGENRAGRQLRWRWAIAGKNSLDIIECKTNFIAAKVRQLSHDIRLKKTLEFAPLVPIGNTAGFCRHRLQPAPLPTGGVATRTPRQHNVARKPGYDWRLGCFPLRDDLTGRRYHAAACRWDHFTSGNDGIQKWYHDVQSKLATCRSNHDALARQDNDTA